MVLGLRWGAATDPGRIREVNEDAAHVEEGLFVVADGVGGHVAGEVASHLAVDTIRAEAPSTGLIEAVRRANQALIDRAERDPAVRGMGTTITAAAVVEVDGQEQLEIVNVGDSRAYLYRDGELQQVTNDHSLVAELEREGRISAAEARVHPQRNIVTRILGNEPDVRIDSFPIDPFRGDRLLLCSDGLSNEVEDREILGILAVEPDPVRAAGVLVDRANAAGGRDNITAIVVDVVDDGGRSTAASAALAGTGTLASRPTETGEAREGGGRRRHRAVGGPRAPGWLTWRTTVFVVAVIAVLGAAVWATWWVSRSTYYVGLDGDEVAIYRGKPGGVLFIDPTYEEGTDLTLDEVPPSRREAVEQGKETGSLAEARAYVSSLRRLAGIPEEPDPSTTTTTIVTTTTTTVTTPAPAAAERPGGTADRPT